MNCIDDDCKYLIYDYEMFCTLKNIEVPENIDEIQCKDFEQEHTCLWCKYSIPTIYETGTIDDVEYRCNLQDKELMYDDSDAMNMHFADIPECNIGKWESSKIVRFSE